MEKILSGIKLAKDLKVELKEKVGKYFPQKQPYIAIVYLWNNPASKTYVNLKKRYWEDIWIHVEIFGQDWDQETEYDEDLNIYKNQEYDNVPKIIELIKYLNFDQDCVWILVQLPLPEEFQEYKNIILASISPKKDIDGLWGVLFGLSATDVIDFVPATPKSVIYLLTKYGLDDVQWKTISILGQSNLVGKPLALELIKKWATVYSTNHYNEQKKIKNITKNSDYIISCTWSIHLIDETYLSPNKNQIIIDVGYGYLDGKPVWDVQIEKIEDKIKYYTPVPGGVGPLTVACLFDNIFVLQDYKKVLKTFVA